jgi:pimeloyl-ACP methyl ester carboxylesterase
MTMIVQQETLNATPSGLRRRIFPTELGPVAVRYSTAAAGARRDSGNADIADVYLHGAAGSWTTFIPLLSFPSGRDAVLMDLPGWGESTGGVQPAALSIDAMARALTGILDTLGYRRWNLVGHSMGGFLALHIAATQPERTASVAAISATTFGVAEACRRPVRGLLLFPAFAGMLLTMRSMAALGGAGSALVRGIGRTPLMRRLMAPFFADPALVADSVIRGLGDDARPASFAAAARAVAGYDFRLWRAVRCPVLATRGDRDVFTPEQDLKELPDLIPQVRLVTIAGSGHFANIEQPGAVHGLLEELQDPPRHPSVPQPLSLPALRELQGLAARPACR